MKKRIGWKVTKPTSYWPSERHDLKFGDDTVYLARVGKSNDLDTKVGEWVTWVGCRDTFKVDGENTKQLRLNSIKKHIDDFEKELKKYNKVQKSKILLLKRLYKRSTPKIRKKK